MIGQNPRIRLGFPCGARNVRVTGPLRRTPSRTAVRPARRRSSSARPASAWSCARFPCWPRQAGAKTPGKRYRIVQEQTREQSYTLDKLAHPGALTGDPDIDDILVQFMRPADLGAA